MICQAPLTPEEMRLSQKNYLRFGIVNGASYMCLGETVIILFAVQLDVPNALVAVLGSMIYFGFLLLPLGKWMTARVGAAQSQADFWLLRNGGALMVALAAPAAVFLNRTLAMVLLTGGAFFFYGFRAAGVVMAQPLIGEICEPDRRGRIISMYNTLFHGFGAFSLLAITLLLKYRSNVWILAGVIVAGAALGGIASGFIRRICETGQIRDSAKRPIRETLAATWAETSVRRQLAAGAVCNLMLILTLPISILAAKKGYGFSDMQALLCSLLQFLVMISGSFVQTRLADRIGARNLLICGYASLPLLCISWLLIPVQAHPFWLAVPFFCCGAASITISNGTAFYFLMSVPKEMQVVASMLISVATGVLAGLAGMFSGSLLLKTAEHIAARYPAIPLFHGYFGMTLILVLLGYVLIHRLPDCRKDQFSKQ